MDEEKKLYLMTLVIALTVSLSCNYFWGANTEAEVWRKISIQAIYEVNQAAIEKQKQEEGQKRLAKAYLQLKSDLTELNDLKVDEILAKYFKGK